MLTTAMLAERQRIDHLVLGKPRPAPTVITTKKRGRRKVIAKVPCVLSPGVEEAVRVQEVYGGGKPTPETLWHHAEHHHEGAIAQLHRNGALSDKQLDWAMQIAYAAESIERDVDVRTASLEARVDQSRRGAVVEQLIGTVRLHMAYTRWRKMLPMPKRLVLDMLVGEPIGFTVAARRHKVHNRKARRYLLDGIDRWPACMKWAEDWVRPDDLDRINALLRGDRLT